MYVFKITTELTGFVANVHLVLLTLTLRLVLVLELTKFLTEVSVFAHKTIMLSVELAVNAQLVQITIRLPKHVYLNATQIKHIMVPHVSAQLTTI